MRTRIKAPAVTAVILMALGACGDGGTGTPSGNTLRVTQTEYAFDVTGELDSGIVSIAVTNDGEELHEMAMAKLQEGRTIEDVRTAVQEATEEEEDFLEGIAEEESNIDDIGGVQAPGTSYTISTAGVEAGDYALLCFIPSSEGTPHAKLGMIAGFTVGEGRSTQATEADATYRVTNDGLDGPSSLDAGTTSIAVVNNSETTREITLFKLAEGRTLSDAGAFFEAAEEGPPDFSNSPFDFFSFVFDAEADRTITVDLTPGDWAIQTPDPESPFEGSPADDPHGVVVTVS